MNASSAFAGRVDELQHLFRCLGKAAREEPQVILFEGAAGMGKSALLQEFGARAAHRRKATYVFHIRPPDGAEYAPVTQAALEATNKLLYDKLGGRRQAIRSARDLLPDWIGVLPGIGDLVAALVATVQAVLRHRRAQPSLTTPLTLDDDAEALASVAIRRPLVLLLDDLDRAGPEAVAQLERFIRGARSGMRLLLVGTTQPASPGSAGAPIQQLVAALPRGTVDVRELKELGIPDLEGWLKKRFPHVVVPPAFLAWLLDRSGGHPATVERLLARLLETGSIRFVNRHWQIDEPVATAEPGVPVENAHIELGALPSTAAGVLEAASVLGIEFHGAAVARLIGADELYVEDQLAIATHHGLLEVLGEVTLPDGEIATRYRFGSPHLRARLYHGLTPDRRSSLERARAAESTPI